MTAAARDQIHHALLSYCRGIDRLQVDLVGAGFHPGALLYGYRSPDPIPIEDFAAHAVASLERRFVATQHRLTNTHIEFAPDATSARVETYVEASHAEPAATDGAQRLQVFAGRYLDRCTPGDDGVWRIAERHLRNDWSRIDTITEPMPGPWIAARRASSPDSP